VSKTWFRNLIKRQPRFSKNGRATGKEGKKKRSFSCSDETEESI
jgi:hypothetical protein